MKYIAYFLEEKMRYSNNNQFGITTSYISKRTNLELYDSLEKLKHHFKLYEDESLEKGKLTLLKIYKVIEELK